MNHMMIKSSLTLVLFLITILAKSQTINKSDIQPQIGEFYLQTYMLEPYNTNPGEAGKNQIWDLSNLNFNEDAKYSYLAMHSDSSPYQIPGADYSLKRFSLSDTSYANYEYYRDTVNGFYLLKEMGAVIQTDYSKPEFQFQFPLNFGDSNYSEYHFSTSAFNVTYFRTGTSSLKFDGTGTLLLPDSIQLTGVYRLKYMSTNIRLGINDTTRIMKYYWYKPGVHHPIAMYTEFFDPGGQVYYSTAIYEISNYGSNHNLTLPLVRIYPNPARDFVNITDCDNAESVCLSDLSGKVVLNAEKIDNSSWKFNTDRLLNGVYLIKICSANNVQSRQLIVEH